MALWQFALDAFPAVKANVDGIDAIYLSRDMLDAMDLTLGPTQQLALFSALGLLLPEKRPWSDELRIWGDEKADDITVFLDGQRIEGIQFRLEVSNLSIALIGGICALAREFGWLFASRRGEVIQPTPEAILRAVTQSPASKFVRDPRGYLEQAITVDDEPA